VKGICIEIGSYAFLIEQVVMFT